MTFPRKKNPLPVVLVRWNDAHTADRTFTDKEKQLEHQPAPTISVGFLVCEDKVGVTIVTDLQLPMLELDEKEISYRSRHFIPRGMIHDITYVRQ